MYWYWHSLCYKHGFVEKFIFHVREGVLFTCIIYSYVRCIYIYIYITKIKRFVGSINVCIKLLVKNHFKFTFDRLSCTFPVSRWTKRRSQKYVHIFHLVNGLWDHNILIFEHFKHLAGPRKNGKKTGNEIKAKSCC